MDYYITPEEYAAGEANGISNNQLTNRVRVFGWSIRDAINTPLRKQVPMGTYAEWAKIAERNGINYRAMMGRINLLGWSAERAATQPLETKEERRNSAIKAHKATRKYPQEYIDLAESNGIGYGTFRMRVIKGKSYEEAATEPLLYKRRKV